MKPSHEFSTPSRTNVIVMPILEKKRKDSNRFRIPQTLEMTPDEIEDEVKQQQVIEETMERVVEVFGIDEDEGDDGVASMMLQSMLTVQMASEDPKLVTVSDYLEEFAKNCEETAAKARKALAKEKSNEKS